MSSKQWWRIAVGAALDNTINNVGNAAVGAGEACLHNKAGHADFNETKKHPRTEADFERFFRRIYQHYGSPEGYVTSLRACLPNPPSLPQLSL